MLITAFIALQGFDQGTSQVTGNLFCGETDHSTVFNSHEVAADTPIERPEFNPLCRRLQRGASRMKLERVVPEETHRPHVASRGH